MMSAPTTDDMAEEARQLWLRYDAEQRSRLAVQAMEPEELAMAMLPRISFGTSGLRAQMGPGFARMNRVTVQIAAIVPYLCASYQSSPVPLVSS